MDKRTPIVSVAYLDTYPDGSASACVTLYGRRFACNAGFTESGVFDAIVRPIDVSEYRRSKSEKGKQASAQKQVEAWFSKILGR